MLTTSSLRRLLLQHFLDVTRLVKRLLPHSANAAGLAIQFAAGACDRARPCFSDQRTQAPFRGLPGAHVWPLLAL